jgi:hypothetical protein
MEIEERAAMTDVEPRKSGGKRDPSTLSCNYLERIECR